MTNLTRAQRIGVALFGKAYTLQQVATFILSAFVLGFTIAGVGVLVIDQTTGSIPAQTDLFSDDDGQEWPSLYPTNS